MLYAAYVSAELSEHAEYAQDGTEPGDEARSDTGADLGDFIRQQRERANLSLRRLADRAGISNPYLSQIERGIRRPSAEILKQLSRALQISAESLYARAGLIEEGSNPPTVVEAVERDERLSGRQKQVLLELYRTLTDNNSQEGET